MLNDEAASDRDAPTAGPSPLTNGPVVANPWPQLARLSQAKTSNRFGRRDDGTFDIFQLHQMRVPRNYEIGFGGGGAREHRVVVGVVDDGRQNDRRDDHRGQGGIALEDCVAVNPRT